MASIRIIDEGTKKQRYQVTYDIKVSNQGVRKRRSKTFPVGTSKKDVQAFCRKVETEYNQANGIDLEYMDITVDGFIPIFDQHCKRQFSPSTVRTYRQAIHSESNGIKQFFKGRKIRQITTPEVQRYIRYLEGQKKQNGEPLSAKTIINQVYVLSAMFEYAMRIGYLERKTNPCQYVETPRRTSKTVEVYTAEEAREVLKLLAEGDDIMLYFAVSLALGCGLRRSEIAALKVQDFNFRKNILNVSRAIVYGAEADAEKDTKTSAGKRAIVIPSGIEEVVGRVRRYKMNCAKQENYCDSEYLYVDEHGRKLHVSTITNRWSKWLKRHPEVKRINFHGLRHTYCSLMLSFGVDIRSLADQMGHSNPVVSLNIYSHSYMETKKEFVNTLNTALYEVSANEG